MAYSLDNSTYVKILDTSISTKFVFSDNYTGKNLVDNGIISVADIAIDTVSGKYGGITTHGKTLQFFDYDKYSREKNNEYSKKFLPIIDPEVNGKLKVPIISVQEIGITDSSTNTYIPVLTLNQVSNKINLVLETDTDIILNDSVLPLNSELYSIKKRFRHLESWCNDIDNDLVEITGTNGLIDKLKDVDEELFYTIHTNAASIQQLNSDISTLNVDISTVQQEFCVYQEYNNNFIQDTSIYINKIDSSITNLKNNFLILNNTLNDLSTYTYLNINKKFSDISTHFNNIIHDTVYPTVEELITHDISTLNKDVNNLLWYKVEQTSKINANIDSSILFVKDEIQQIYQYLNNIDSSIRTINQEISRIDNTLLELDNLHVWNEF